MADVIKKTFLQAVRLERDKVSDFKSYPFCIPAVRHLDRLEFHPAVTFFIGENGTGKSTLLEAIATKYGFNAEGGSKNFNFATQDKAHADIPRENNGVRIDRWRLERCELHVQIAQDVEAHYCALVLFRRVTINLVTRAAILRFFSDDPAVFPYV